MPLAKLPTGATLHYEVTGAASAPAPVILMPGLLGTARSQLGAVMEWLGEQGFRVIGLTLRGYGESQPKPRDFPDDFYQRDAGDLLAFMDALAIARAHLIGYSDGGEVALLAAGMAPARFASCIAIGAVGHYAPDLRSQFQRLYPGEWITEEDKALHGFSDAVGFTRDWVRAVTRIIDAGGDISFSQASRMRCPLIIMLGDEDRLNPRALGERFVAETPRGRLAVFACGHAVHERQSRAFQEMTLAHLLAAGD